MGVLRSLTALQMYQRATRSPIAGAEVAAFLLYDREFPRSVSGCLQRIKSSLSRLPRPQRTLPAAEAIEGLLGNLKADAGDGAALDAAMDQVQDALGLLNDVVHDTFVRAAD
jgi:uncharacterized alpha-E superfamily protein